MKALRHRQEHPAPGRRQAFGPLGCSHLTATPSQLRRGSRNVSAQSLFLFNCEPLRKREEAGVGGNPTTQPGLGL